MITKSNKRLFPRVQFKGQLHYQVRGTHVFTNTLVDDISSGGVAFANDRYLPPLTQLNIEINLNNHVLHPIGKVIWTSPFSHADRFRTGVEFLEFDQREKKLLTEFVGMRLDQTQGA